MLCLWEETEKQQTAGIDGRYDYPSRYKCFEPLCLSKSAAFTDLLADLHVQVSQSGRNVRLVGKYWQRSSKRQFVQTLRSSLDRWRPCP